MRALNEEEMKLLEIVIDYELENDVPSSIKIAEDINMFLQQLKE